MQARGAAAIHDSWHARTRVVDDAQIAEAIRVLMRTTHNLAEGAGAAGLAGLFALREELAQKRVAVVYCATPSRETSDGTRIASHTGRRRHSCLSAN